MRTALLCLGMLIGSTLPAKRSAPDLVPLTYRISQRTIISGESHCSATAIGPHALLTASHCEEPTDRLTIDDEDTDVQIDKRIRDDYDHTIYLIAGTSFPKTAEMDWEGLKRGDDIYFVGNPGEYRSLFRRGLYSGAKVSGHGVAEMLFDVSLSNGDSGSGVFNAAGKIVGVVSFMTVPEDQDGIKLGGGYPLEFTHKQIAEAVAYSGK